MAVSRRPAAVVLGLVGVVLLVALLATALLRRGVGAVVITLGAAGAYVATTEHRETIPGHRVEARDTTGAGDAFVACFALLRAANANVPDALRAANVAAALSTLVPGAQAGLPTWDQVRPVLGGVPA